jgi:hypothetical protein
LPLRLTNKTLLMVAETLDVEDTLATRILGNSCNWKRVQGIVSRQNSTRGTTRAMKDNERRGTVGRTYGEEGTPHSGAWQANLVSVYGLVKSTEGHP